MATLYELTGQFLDIARKNEIDRLKKLNDADKAKKDRMKTTLEESMELTGHEGFR